MLYHMDTTITSDPVVVLLLVHVPIDFFLASMLQPHVHLSFAHILMYMY